MAYESRRRADWAAVGILLVAILVLFTPALRHPDYLLYPTFSPHSDLTVIHWPKAHLMLQTWQAARTLPLWTPANLSGMPLAANQLAMRFYPPAWLFLLLPINLTFNLLFVFHLFWGGLGTYRLLRVGFDLDPIPALAGALTFALGGKLLAHAAGGHVSMVGAVAWMPWTIWGGTMLLRQHRMRWAVLAAVALAMQIATHSLITLYTGYFLAVYLVWIAASRQPSTVSGQRPAVSHLKSAIRNLQSAILIPILAALLGAAQLLPLAELAGYSNRALSLAQAGEFALTPLTLLVGLFLPDARGGHEMVVYGGLVPLVLACFGFSRTDRRSWFLGGVVVLAVLFALGPATPLFELVYRWAPGFHWVRTPARAFLPASLAVAMLTGMGMQRLAKGQAGWSTPVALAVGVLTLALGAGLATLLGQVNRAVLGLAVFPSLALLVVGLTARRRLSPRLALPGLALLVFADLASFDATLMRFISPATAFADGEAVAGYLAAQPGLFRTYSPSTSLPPHVAARAGLQTADGVEPVHLAIYDRFMALAGGYGDASFSVTIPPFPPNQPLTEAHRDTQPDLRLLGLLNVEYLVAAFPMDWPGLTPVTEVKGTFVYRNQYALPRAWVIHPPAAGAIRADVGDDWPKQLAALADLAAQSVAAGESVATVTRYEPDRIEVEADLPAPGLLILSEIWHPGWRVMVGGKARPVERVVGILRGVSLDAGRRQVVFVYDPTSARWGTWLSLIGWAGVAVGAAVMVWPKRKQ